MVTLPVRVHIFCHELLYKHWKDLAWKTMDDETISKAGLMALALDRLRNGMERQKRAAVCFNSKVFAHAKADGHETLKNMIWINDGRQNTMVDRRNPKAIPEGWVEGMLYKDDRSRYRWFTNGKIDIKLFPEDPVPEGYVRGRTTGKKAKGKLWYHDGAGNEQYFAADEKIPEGWVRGRSKVSRSKMSTSRANKMIVEGKEYNRKDAAGKIGISYDRLLAYIKRGFTAQDVYDIEHSGGSESERMLIYRRGKPESK